ncbi:MAG: hypothetical protein AAGF57_16555 [Pseudomonadota bacterium]
MSKRTLHIRSSGVELSLDKLIGRYVYERTTHVSAKRDDQYSETEDELAYFPNDDPYAETPLPEKC